MAGRLFDTDILVDTLRGARNAGPRLEVAANLGILYTSSVTVFELECGALAKDERLKIQRLLAYFDVVSLDHASAVEAGAIDRKLRAAGIRLDARDTMIAGTALAYSMELVTRNRRHFERVPGLILSDL